MNNYYLKVVQVKGVEVLNQYKEAVAFASSPEELVCGGHQLCYRGGRFPGLQRYLEDALGDLDRCVVFMCLCADDFGNFVGHYFIMH